MPEPRGKVFRFVYPESGVPRIEHRKRNADALFTAAEWEWTQDLDEGYIFERYETCSPADPNRSAEDHVKQLRAEGERHAHAKVYGSEAEAAAQIRARERRENTRVEVLRASARHVEPHEAAAELERRHLF